MLLFDLESMMGSVREDNGDFLSFLYSYWGGNITPDWSLVCTIWWHTLLMCVPWMTERKPEISGNWIIVLHIGNNDYKSLARFTSSLCDLAWEKSACSKHYLIQMRMQPWVFWYLFKNKLLSYKHADVYHRTYTENCQLYSSMIKWSTESW